MSFRVLINFVTGQRKTSDALIWKTDGGKRVHSDAVPQPCPGKAVLAVWGRGGPKFRH